MPRCRQNLCDRATQGSPDCRAGRAPGGGVDATASHSLPRDPGRCRRSCRCRRLAMPAHRCAGAGRCRPWGRTGTAMHAVRGARNGEWTWSPRSFLPGYACGTSARGNANRQSLPGWRNDRRGDCLDLPTVPPDLRRNVFRSEALQRRQHAGVDRLVDPNSNAGARNGALHGHALRFGRMAEAGECAFAERHGLG